MTTLTGHYFPIQENIITCNYKKGLKVCVVCESEKLCIDYYHMSQVYWDTAVEFGKRYMYIQYIIVLSRVCDHATILP